MSIHVSTIQCNIYKFQHLKVRHRYPRINMTHWMCKWVIKRFLNHDLCFKILINFMHWYMHSTCSCIYALLFRQYFGHLVLSWVILSCIDLWKKTLRKFLGLMVHYCTLTFQAVNKGNFFLVLTLGRNCFCPLKEENLKNVMSVKR